MQVRVNPRNANAPAEIGYTHINRLTIELQGDETVPQFMKKHDDEEQQGDNNTEDRPFKAFIGNHSKLNARPHQNERESDMHLDIDATHAK